MMTAGDEYKASVVGFDEDKDVAVLKINVEGNKVSRSTGPRLLLTHSRVDSVSSLKSWSLLPMAPVARGSH